MLKNIALMTSFCLVWFNAFAQKSRNNAEIMKGLEKLKVLGSVLYIAAHPDDENTRLITHLSKGRAYRTAYLSLTRGDGGQNLIGEDLDEYLGVIRTQELVEARKIDGGIQFFTRAKDFGYSKNAQETFSIWDKDSILADVIRVIREFKPDVIIHRFDHRKSGSTHGHHTASAILGMEGFKYSNSPLFMRSTLSNSPSHLVQRIFFNTSSFFYGKEKFDTMNKSFLYTMDVGEFYPAYGQSNNEIAAQSRSMHKSQGFGINSSRGMMIEYFERLDAPKDPSHTDPFEGLNLSWSRINGGGNIEAVINEAIKLYDYAKPWTIVPLLQKAESYMMDLPEHDWKQIKLEEIRQLILDCSGIFAESFTHHQMLSHSTSFDFTTEFIVRNPVAVTLRKIDFEWMSKDTTINIKLATNKPNQIMHSGFIHPATPITSPYWLLGEHTIDALILNKYSPIGNRKLLVKFDYTVNEKSYSLTREIIYKNDDPVLGEIKEPLDILPPAVILADDHLYLQKGNKVTCEIKLLSVSTTRETSISLVLPEGFECQPKERQVRWSNSGEIIPLTFEIFTKSILDSCLQIPILMDGQMAYFFKPIKYPHIQKQNTLIPAKLRVISTDVRSKIKKVAYVEGAGDFTDNAIQMLGHTVTYLKPDQLNQLEFKRFDVVVFGIRALNVHEALKNCSSILDRFMRQGGKVIMQYNTTADLVTTQFAPSPLKFDRSRVTNEHSLVEIIKKDHSLFKFPNKISLKDFEQWVQERGLYFPTVYDSSYVELLSMNDPGENPLKSGILVKPVGKGQFVYTPLAWFRQIKAGVPGAYRLFSNLISFD